MPLRLLAVAATATALVVPAGAAGAAPRTNPVVRAEVVTEVTPLGWKVVAVALEHSRRLDITRAATASGAFTVTATVGGETAERTVTDVYSSDEPAVDRQGARGSAGRWLVLELDEDDANAGALVYDVTRGQNDPVPLEGAYAVRQTERVEDPRTGTVLPASPFVVRNQGVVSPEVEDFTALTYTDSAGTTLPFRLYQPEAYREDPDADREYPLVVFLHGGGERGTNNITQITANRGAVTFTEPERQAEDPAFVLAPQVPPGRENSWVSPPVQAAMLELVQRIARTRPVDRDRLYLTGLSMGGYGSFDVLPERPGLFAGALVIAGGGNAERMRRIVDVPLWITHSVDDPTVDYTAGSLANVRALERAGAEVVRGTWPGDLDERTREAEARRLLRVADRRGSHTLFTTFAAGTTPVSPHWSWVPTYENDVMVDWLLDQDRSERTARAGTALVAAP
ncbi:alpha/beta hydrolase-fold protein [Vallicoccus soli]|uniref:Phospholipase n=1 Tax=Vallicoccus soli TaxID=2339232 RepID=A0A3A3YTY5_9ACTN|nr:alpha/beta hydrolase-fold protein [Vallicoccus soli]RJK93709.1 phospholipase [Vallicoccus soli]